MTGLTPATASTINTMATTQSILTLPAPGGKGAPKKFSGSHTEIATLLDHYDQLIQQYNITTGADQCKALLRYCNRKVRETIEGLRSYTDGDYASLRKDLLEIYDDELLRERHNRKSLQDFVRRRNKKKIRNMAEFKDYEREFLRIGGWLLSQKRITERECNDSFWKGLPLSFCRTLEQHIIAMNPTHDLRVPFERKDVIQAAGHVLFRARFDADRDNDPDQIDTGNISLDNSGDSETDYESESDEDYKRRKKLLKEVKKLREMENKGKDKEKRNQKHQNQEDDDDWIIPAKDEEQEMENLVRRMNKMEIHTVNYRSMYLKAITKYPKMEKVLKPPLLIEPQVQNVVANNNTTSYVPPMPRNPPYNHQPPDIPPRNPTYPPGGRAPPPHFQPNIPRPPPQMNRSSMGPNPSLCYGCGEVGHRIGQCRQIENLLERNIIARDLRGRLMWKDGSQIQRDSGHEPFARAIERQTGQAHLVTLAAFKQKRRPKMVAPDREDPGDVSDSEESDYAESEEFEAMEVHRPERVSKEARRQVMKEVVLPARNPGARGKENKKPEKAPRQSGLQKATEKRVNEPVLVPVQVQPPTFDADKDDDLMEDVSPPRRVAADKKVIHQKTDGQMAPRRKQPRKSDLTAHVNPTIVMNKILNTPMTVSIGEFIGCSREVSNHLQKILRVRRGEQGGVTDLPVAKTLLTRARGKLIRIRIEHEGRPVEAVVDSGSMLNIMSQKVWKSTITQPIDVTKCIKMNDANGGVGKLTGVASGVSLYCGNIKTVADLYVGSHVPFDLLLGRPWQRDNRVGIDERQDGTYLVFKGKDETENQYEMLVVPDKRARLGGLVEWEDSMLIQSDYSDAPENIFMTTVAPNEPRSDPTIWETEEGDPYQGEPEGTIEEIGEEPPSSIEAEVGSKKTNLLSDADETTLNISDLFLDIERNEEVSAPELDVRIRERTMLGYETRDMGQLHEYEQIAITATPPLIDEEAGPVPFPAEFHLRLMGQVFENEAKDIRQEAETLKRIRSNGEKKTVWSNCSGYLAHLTAWMFLGIMGWCSSKAQELHKNKVPKTLATSLWLEKYDIISTISEGEWETLDRSTQTKSRDPPVGRLGMLRKYNRFRLLTGKSAMYPDAHYLAAQEIVIIMRYRRDPRGRRTYVPDWETAGLFADDAKLPQSARLWFHAIRNSERRCASLGLIEDPPFYQEELQKFYRESLEERGDRWIGTDWRYYDRNVEYLRAMSHILTTRAETPARYEVWRMQGSEQYYTNHHFAKWSLTAQHAISIPDMSEDQSIPLVMSVVATESKKRKRSDEQITEPTSAKRKAAGSKTRKPAEEPSKRTVDQPVKIGRRRMVGYELTKSELVNECERIAVLATVPLREVAADLPEPKPREAASRVSVRVMKGHVRKAHEETKEIRAIKEEAEGAPTAVKEKKKRSRDQGTLSPLWQEDFRNIAQLNDADWEIADRMIKEESDEDRRDRLTAMRRKANRYRLLVGKKPLYRDAHFLAAQEIVIISRYRRDIHGKRDHIPDYKIADEFADDEGVPESARVWFHLIRNVDRRIAGVESIVDPPFFDHQLRSFYKKTAAFKQKNIGKLCWTDYEHDHDLFTSLTDLFLARHESYSLPDDKLPTVPEVPHRIDPEADGIHRYLTRLNLIMGPVLNPVPRQTEPPKRADTPRPLFITHEISDEDDDELLLVGMLEIADEVDKEERESGRTPSGTLVKEDSAPGESPGQNATPCEKRNIECEIVTSEQRSLARIEKRRPMVDRIHEITPLEINPPLMGVSADTDWPEEWDFYDFILNEAWFEDISIRDAKALLFGETYPASPTGPVEEEDERNRLVRRAIPKFEREDEVEWAVVSRVIKPRNLYDEIEPSTGHGPRTKVHDEIMELYCEDFDLLEVMNRSDWEMLAQLARIESKKRTRRQCGRVSRKGDRYRLLTGQRPAHRDGHIMAAYEILSYAWHRRDEVGRRYNQPTYQVADKFADLKEMPEAGRLWFHLIRNSEREMRDLPQVPEPEYVSRELRKFAQDQLNDYDNTEEIFCTRWRDYRADIEIYEEIKSTVTNRKKQRAMLHLPVTKALVAAEQLSDALDEYLERWGLKKRNEESKKYVQEPSGKEEVEAPATRTYTSDKGEGTPTPDPYGTQQPLVLFMSIASTNHPSEDEIPGLEEVPMIEDDRFRRSLQDAINASTNHFGHDLLGQAERYARAELLPQARTFRPALFSSAQVRELGISLDPNGGVSYDFLGLGAGMVVDPNLSGPRSTPGCFFIRFMPDFGPRYQLAHPPPLVAVEEAFTRLFNFRSYQMGTSDGHRAESPPAPPSTPNHLTTGPATESNALPLTRPNLPKFAPYVRPHFMPFNVNLGQPRRNPTQFIVRQPALRDHRGATIENEYIQPVTTEVGTDVNVVPRPSFDHPFDFAPPLDISTGNPLPRPHVSLPPITVLTDPLLSTPTLNHEPDHELKGLTNRVEALERNRTAMDCTLDTLEERVDETSEYADGLAAQLEDVAKDVEHLERNVTEINRDAGMLKETVVSEIERQAMNRAKSVEEEIVKVLTRMEKELEDAMRIHIEAEAIDKVGAVQGLLQMSQGSVAAPASPKSFTPARPAEITITTYSDDDIKMEEFEEAPKGLRPVKPRRGGKSAPHLRPISQPHAAVAVTA